MKLVILHKVNFIALQEPFMAPSQIEEFRELLGFDNAMANNNRKILCLWNHTLNCTLISQHKQQMTFKVNQVGDSDHIWFTVVYAKTNASRKKYSGGNLRECTL